MWIENYHSYVHTHMVLSFNTYFLLDTFFSKAGNYI